MRAAQWLWRAATVVALVSVTVVAAPRSAQAADPGTADAGVLAGTVTASGGGPLVGAAVRTWCYGCPRDERTTTGPTGAYRFAELPDGDYVVEVTPPAERSDLLMELYPNTHLVPDGYYAPQPTAVALHGAGHDGVDLVLDRAQRVRVTARSAGAVVPGTYAGVECADGWRAYGPDDDGDGEVVLDGQPECRALVSAAVGGRQRYAGDVDTTAGALLYDLGTDGDDERAVAIDLGPAPTPGPPETPHTDVYGSVHAVDGSHILGTVTVVPNVGPPTTVLANDSGSGFTLRAFGTGTIRLLITDYGDRVERAPLLADLTVTGEEDQDAGRFTLQPGQALRVDVSGPIGGGVQVQAYEPTTGLSVSHATASPSEPTAVLHDLPAGDVLVAADTNNSTAATTWAPSTYDRAQAGRIRGDSGSTSLTLLAGARLQGCVYDPDGGTHQGNGDVGPQNHTYRVDGPRSLRGFAAGPCFVAGGLTPGSYTVQTESLIGELENNDVLADVSYHGRSVCDLEPIVLETGDDVTADLHLVRRGTIRGRVVDDRTGDPVVNGTIATTNECGGYGGSATTGPDGSFVVHPASGTGAIAKLTDVPWGEPTNQELLEGGQPRVKTIAREWYDHAATADEATIIPVEPYAAPAARSAATASGFRTAALPPSTEVGEPILFAVGRTPSATDGVGDPTPQVPEVGLPVLAVVTAATSARLVVARGRRRRRQGR